MVGELHFHHVPNELGSEKHDLNGDKHPPSQGTFIIPHRLIMYPLSKKNKYACPASNPHTATPPIGVTEIGAEKTPLLQQAGRSDMRE
jgi:hypothetical protein